MIRIKVWMVCAFILWSLGYLLLGCWIGYEYHDKNEAILWWYPHAVGGTIGVGIGYTLGDYAIKRLEKRKNK